MKARDQQLAPGLLEPKGERAGLMGDHKGADLVYEGLGGIEQ